MHPAQIKAALTMAGYKQTDLATACGVAPTTIGAVINGRSRSQQVEERIAALTGIALAELWPQWYGEGPLVLTTEERLLVTDFRTLSAVQREQALAMLQALKRGVPVGSSVIGTGRSRVAGRDFNVSVGRDLKAGRDVHVGASRSRKKP